MAKFIITEARIENRHTVQRRFPYKSLRSGEGGTNIIKHEEAEIRIRIVGSGDTSNITDEQILEALLKADLWQDFTGQAPLT